MAHYFTIAQPSIVAVGLRYLDNAKRGLDKWRADSRGDDNNAALAVQILIVDDGSVGSSDISAPLVRRTGVVKKGSWSINSLFKFPHDLICTKYLPLPAYHLSSDAREAPAAMVFSSGTSGKPKGVLLSHYNLMAYAIMGRTTDPLLHNGWQREVVFTPCMSPTLPMI